MYLCVRVRVCVSVCVCEEDVHKKRKRNENEKSSKGEKKEKWKHKLIHIDKKIDRQTDGWTDRHKSFIDIRNNTEQYSKSNSIE